MIDKPKWTKLFSEDGILLYEGSTLFDKPFGAGTAYFPNGNIYQEGIFDIKGLLYGREYFPTGQLRFEGCFEICRGYGPNYPVFGKCYDEAGRMYYEGQLEIQRSSVGYPSVLEPKAFGPVPQNESPRLDYFMWEDADKVGLRDKKFY